MKLFAKIATPIIVVAVILCAILLLYAPNASKHISIQNNHLSKVVDDEFNVIEDCGITFHLVQDPKPFFTCSNPDIVQVDFYSGDAKCLSKGIATITIMLETDDNSICQKDVTIVVSEKLIYPEYAYFDHNSIVVYLGKSSTNRLNISPNSFTPRIYSKNGNATYNSETGEVNATQNDTIFLEIPKNETDKFLIKFDIVIETRQIIKISKTITVGNAKKIDYQSDISAALEDSGFSNATSSNPECVSILSEHYGYIYVDAKELGQSLITLSNHKYIIEISVTVSEEEIDPQP